MSIEHLTRGQVEWANNLFMDVVRGKWHAQLREVLAWALAFLGLGGAVSIGAQSKVRSHITRIDGSGAILDRFWADEPPASTDRDIQRPLAQFIEKSRPGKGAAGAQHPVALHGAGGRVRPAVVLLLA
jgi:type IV secretory pathway TrbF-like protein